MRRLSLTDRVSAAVLLTGIAACYLSWGGYDISAGHVSLAGFRISALGDIYFVAAVVALMAMAGRFDLIHMGSDPGRIGAIAVHVAVAAAALQLVAGALTGEGVGKGLVIAIAAVASLEYLAIRPIGQTRDMAFDRR